MPTYQSKSTVTAAGSSMTHSSMAIGTASASRTVVAMVATRQGSLTLDSATIGGESATIHTTDKDATFGFGVAVLSATVATGTTADVVLNFSGSATWSYVVLYTEDDITVSGTDTANVQGNDATVTVPDGGYVFAISSSHQGNLDHSWTNVTERTDDYIASGNGDRASAADDFSPSAGSLTVSCNGSLYWSMAVAVFEVVAAGSARQLVDGGLVNNGLVSGGLIG